MYITRDYIVRQTKKLGFYRTVNNKKLRVNIQFTHANTFPNCGSDIQRFQIFSLPQQLTHLHRCTIQYQLAWIAKVCFI